MDFLWILLEYFNGSLPVVVTAFSVLRVAEVVSFHEYSSVFKAMLTAKWICQTRIKCLVHVPVRVVLSMKCVFMYACITSGTGTVCTYAQLPKALGARHARDKTHFGLLMLVFIDGFS